MSDTTYTGQSSEQGVPAISGNNTAAGTGVWGVSLDGPGGVGTSIVAGVYGYGQSQPAVYGVSDGSFGVVGESNSAAHVGVFGRNDQGLAVQGVSLGGGVGVSGISQSGVGVDGSSQTTNGVYGHSESGSGVYGESTHSYGVYGVSNSADFAAVFGHNDQGTAVLGQSVAGTGVAGFSQIWQGVYGHSNSQAGVVGESDGFDGVYGISHSATSAAVSGHNDKGGWAGYFDGKVMVTVDLYIQNADCAEEFDIADPAQVEPGTVMVLDGCEALRPSQHAYDKRVAGVISGAGAYKPAIILDKQPTLPARMPVALVGKVYCKVDAQYAPIEVGDLLTTSPTPGHAMRADDPLKAFGAVIGKALRAQPEGQGLIPVLIALQ